jgi:hypothetical protein
MLPKAEGLAHQFEDVGMVGDTVEQGRGETFISKDFIMPSFGNA